MTKKRVHPIQELKHICETQKTVSTSRLITIVKRAEELHITQGKRVRHFKKAYTKLNEKHSKLLKKSGGR